MTGVQTCALPIFNRGARLTELLKQAQFSPLAFEEQTVSIFAGTNGYLDGIAASQVTDYEAKMLSWMHAEHEDVFKDIRDSRDLGDGAKAKLVAALDAFGKIYA